MRAWRDPSLLQLFEGLLESFADREPQWLVEALKEAPPRTLCNACWRRDRPETKRPDTPFARWDAFAETALRAAELAPTTMIPQLLLFLVSFPETMVSDGSVFHPPKLEKETAERLFGLPRLKSLFGKHQIETDAMSEDTKTMYLAVLEALAEEEPEEG